MQHSPQTTSSQGAIQPGDASVPDGLDKSRGWPALVLGWMMFLVPALGFPGVLMLQDTLKSAVVAAGVLAAALWFFWQQRQRTAPLLWHGLIWLPVLLMAYALGSMVWSHTYLAAVEAVRWFVLSLLLWLGLNSVTRDQVPALAWGIHAGAAVASLWAALQFWLDLRLFPQAAVPASTFINRNFFAEYAVCALPFSVYVLATMRQSRWLGWAAASVALVVVATLMTGTRSALLALLVLAMVFPVILVRYRQQLAYSHWSPAHKLLVALVLAGGVLGLGSVPSGNPQVIAERAGATAWQHYASRAASMTDKREYAEGSFSTRALMWRATARMMMAHPLQGVGAGAWEVQIPLYQRAGESMETDYYAHNELLQLLSEYGLVVGGLFLAFLFAYLLIAAGKTWNLQGADRQEAPLRSLTLASLLALLIVSNAGFPWRLAGTGALFALSLALLAASDTRLGVRERLYATQLAWRPIFSQSVVAALLCCILLAAYITQQAMQAERKIVRAVQLSVAFERLALSDVKQSKTLKAQMLQSLREGMAINPHYRKLTTLVADRLAAAGDWENAVWIWETLAASRPYVAVIWANMARGYAQRNNNDRAMDALKHAQQLQPDEPGMNAMQVLLLYRTGHEAQATQTVNDLFDQGRYDYALVQAGYALGLQTHDWPMAIRSLELRNQTWPEQAADGYFRLGAIYADPALHDDAKALAAFRAGMQVVPPEQKDHFRNQVPGRYRSKL